MSIKVKARNVVKSMVIMSYRIMNRILPLNKRMIVMSSSLGKSYAGNPKAIYEEMLVKGYDKSYQIIWFYEKNRYQIPGNHTQIKYGRFRYLYYMARAQYWIFDARQPEFIKKRHGVAYLQTWHGTPLKKLGLDIEQVHMAGEDDVERYKQGVRDNAGTWDYLVSQNPYSTQIFRQAFDFQGEFLEIGYPRNDLLFSNNESNIQELKVRFGLPLDKKIILYAPTWRDDEGIGLGAYRFVSGLDLDLMQDMLSDEYIMIIKYHYLVRDERDWSKYSNFIFQFDQSVDISMLYLVSDLLITDYSSVMFDYAILKRPIYFYCYDLEHYKNILRGFYFSFEEEAPGPITKTTEQLIRAIASDESSVYMHKYEAFRAKFNPWDDGNASAKILEKMLQ